MTKPHLLILPGWGGSADTWKPFLARATSFDAVCLDLPCFGDMPCPDTVWGVEEYAAFVVREITKRTMHRPLLLGHSFGGQIAVYLAAHHPALFSGLVLVAPAVIRQRRPLRRLFFFLIAKSGKVLFRLPLVEKGSVIAKRVLYRMADSPDYLETAGIKREIFKKILREDQRQTLKKITLPTRIIWGTRDRYTPVRYAKKVARRIPQATLDVIPNGKHGLHLQMPDALLASVKKIYDSR